MPKKFEELLDNMKKRVMGFPQTDYKSLYYSNDSDLPEAMADLIRLIEASHNALLYALKSDVGTKSRDSKGR